MNYKNPNSPFPDLPYQCRVTHPERGRISLGWFATPADVDAARAEFNDHYCPDRERCRHPEHVKARQEQRRKRAKASR